MAVEKWNAEVSSQVTFTILQETDCLDRHDEDTRDLFAEAPDVTSAGLHLEMGGEVLRVIYGEVTRQEDCCLQPAMFRRDFAAGQLHHLDSLRFHESESLCSVHRITRIQPRGHTRKGTGLI